MYMTDELRWFSSSNTARRDGGYVQGERIWEWVPSGKPGKFKREMVSGSHPYCVVVGSEKLSVDFLNGVHSLTGVPESTVLCVETAKVILLNTLSTETTNRFAFCHGWVFVRSMIGRSKSAGAVQEIEMVEKLIKPGRVWRPRGKSIIWKLMNHLPFIMTRELIYFTMHRVFCLANGGVRLLARWEPSGDALGGILKSASLRHRSSLH
jgi:hypothetical protein